MNTLILEGHGGSISLVDAADSEASSPQHAPPPADKLALAVAESDSAWAALLGADAVSSSASTSL